MRKNHNRLSAAIILFAPALAMAQTAQDANAPEIQVAQAAGGAPVAQYEAILKETEGLQVYNQLLERQIAAQQEEMTEVQTAITEVPEIERQLPPLLLRMVDGLAEFVRLDLPFLTEERQERVANLQLLVERADINDSEKFRRILEAWQIETEYGSGFSTYVGELSIDGQSREVDFLQVGRIALIYQTTDEQASTGVWDASNKTWVPLGSEHRNSVRQALRMARNQIAPELVLLPVPPPQ